MKAVNLLLLTRTHESKTVSMLYHALSGRTDRKPVSEHEAASLWTFTDKIASCLGKFTEKVEMPEESQLFSGNHLSEGRHSSMGNHDFARGHNSAGSGISCLDGFFFSYVIEHIGKEFDLLKIARDGSCILNIELKSEMIGEERIGRQLEQNRYYLSHIARTIWSFTYVMEEDRLYQMNEKGHLRVCGMEELAAVLMKDVFREYLPEGIDSFFKAADYLISPVASPEKFLAGKYFLTNQQFDFRRRILDCLKEAPAKEDRPPVIGVSGIAGTGKTLLLLDLALELSKKQRVLFVHSGPLRKGHQVIDRRLKNVDITGAGSIHDADLKGYAYLMIDEADHLEADVLERLLADAEKCRIPVILSYDPHELLFEAGRDRTPEGELQPGERSGESRNPEAVTAGAQGGADAGAEGPNVRFERICTLRLSFTGNIRINRPVYSFLRTLLNLNDRPGRHDYSCIDVVYAGSEEERDLIEAYYRDRGYVLVSDQNGAETEEDVIAREYDRVLMVLDDSFFYDEAGHLREKKNEREALRLLYEGLSRTRDSLCLLVTGGTELFEAVLSVRLEQ